MKHVFIAVFAILLSSPVSAHPRNLKHTYYYPEKDVMVRKDWKRCKKIKYITKYDKWGWYTERKILPLEGCSVSQHDHDDVKIKVIIK